MNIKTGKKQSIKNIAYNIVAFVMQLFISLYIAPLIVGKVGAAAYGFIGLANDFVMYASILASVFNSVASRFIANSFYKEDFERANKYFNSLIVANLVIAGFLGIVSVILVPNLNSIIEIPEQLVFDVKLTFALIFMSYIITVVTMVFTTSTFVTNRTDIQGIRNVIQYIIRFALIIVFLNFVSIRIYWVALAMLIASVIVAIMNIGLTKQLTPELKINIKHSSKEYAKELAKSGSWMSLTILSTILLRGLDLTVANVLIGDYEMGLLSIARTLPNNLTSVVGTIAPVFTPVFIVYYAKNSLDKLAENTKQSINIMAMLFFVPITGFIVFSYDFYSLWQKSLNNQELLLVSFLSTLTVVQTYFDATTSTMAQLSVVVNRLKIPVLVTLGCGVFSVFTEIVLIKHTSLGLYAIVLSTSIIMILRYIVFNSMYAAWCLNKPFSFFALDVGKTWVSIPILIIVMLLVKKANPVSSWLTFIIDVVICAFICYPIMVMVYGKKELISLINRIRNRYSEH